MEKVYPQKPFELYVDDFVVYCKTEKQAELTLRQIQERMKSYKLDLHEQKSKIDNLRGFSVGNYPKVFDFLGFTIKLRPYKVNGTGAIKSIPCICVSQ